MREGLAQAMQGLEGMIDKEERILFPMALDTLTRDEWGLVWHESPRVGWCLVEPRAGYTPPTSSTPRNMLDAPAGHAILLPTGHVTVEQLGAVLHTLPVDLTFVDTDDRVAFYSEGPERIFSRSRAVIGRKVQHCHPPRSVAVVDRILDDFRAGRQSTAEFWIEMRGRFIHIRYFAVRNKDAEYMGCLEMTQDVTKIRALQGERRLLAYEDDSAPAPVSMPDAAPLPPPEATTAPAPAVNAALIVRIVDADEMLATGTHPLNLVQEGAATLRHGQALAVDSSFVPKPLIDMLGNGGYEVTMTRAPDGRHRTVVRRRG